MNNRNPTPERPARPARPELAVFAQTLCRGIADKFQPSDRLELVSYLVTWAVAELSTRKDWSVVRPWLNDVLAPAIAAGLDVGFGFPGHAARVDSLPPGGEGIL